MRGSYEYIIIGGGIVGTSVAFELAKRGKHNILLIEKEYLASGATGRCAAGIRQQWGSLLNATLAVESTEIFENLPQYGDTLYCEWAPNEKVATEMAYGASIASVRSLCAMKHV